MARIRKAVFPAAVSLALTFAFLVPVCAASQSSATCSLKGFVTDLFGNPLPGAVVAVAGTGQRVVTASTGEYRLEGLSDGKVDVRASFQGFHVAERSVQLRCDAAERTPSLDFGLVVGLIGDPEPFVLSGTVLGEASSPVGTASVVLENRFDSGVRVSSGSNDKGEFRLEVKQPGQYVLRVAKAGFAAYSESLTVPPGFGSRQRQVRIVLKPIAARPKSPHEVVR